MLDAVLDLITHKLTISDAILCGLPLEYPQPTSLLLDKEYHEHSERTI
ncbi:hypothetical protein JCM19239_2562 [Vibrio variabilis]|uniref:Uncharacterized protein n=1 Tax=Vibrio variabilis TaxID=990271 RepID=A0ABQ0JR28_9VIBR|nr:hypothetical protein JCM19239_2562 [Vibrio variabilis]